MELISVPSLVKGVKLRGSLRKNVARDQLVQALSDRIKLAFSASLALLTHNLSLILLISRCIRNSGADKYGLDEEEVLLLIMSKLFPDSMNGQALDDIKSQYQVLVEHNLVRKINVFTRSYYWLFPSQKKELY